MDKNFQGLEEQAGRLRYVFQGLEGLLFFALFRG